MTNLRQGALTLTLNRGRYMFILYCGLIAAITFVALGLKKATLLTLTALAGDAIIGSLRIGINAITANATTNGVGIEGQLSLMELILCLSLIHISEPTRPY